MECLGEQGLYFSGKGDSRLRSRPVLRGTRVAVSSTPWPASRDSSGQVKQAAGGQCDLPLSAGAGAGEVESGETRSSSFFLV